MRTHWLAIAILMTAACATLAVGGSSIAEAQNDWRVGEIVGLREGTCIREGPGFNYPAHTRVPENDWAVMVIGGPRRADGKTWFDTSRATAGDPSGGTGWVDRSQTDMCPAEDTGPPRTGSWIERLRSWWRNQTGSAKWVFALVVLAVLVGAWHRLSLSVFSLLRVFLLGLIIWWIADQTRDVWEPSWWDTVGRDAPDLAILLGLIPAVSYLLPRLLARRARR